LPLVQFHIEFDQMIDQHNLMDSSSTIGRPRETRLHLLEAGILCFAERGYEATTIREIADRAGKLVSLIGYHLFSTHVHPLPVFPVQPGLPGARGPQGEPGSGRPATAFDRPGDDG
jgi:hypothetical protein